MQFKQYLKITLPGGDLFITPSLEGFTQLECKGPFPHIIWEKGATDFWFVDEKGIATYTPKFWLHPSTCFSFISSERWIAEPMNPRFIHSDPKVTEFWRGYLELINERLWHIFYDPDNAPTLCGNLTTEDLKSYVSGGTWKQVPPIQPSPTTQPKPEPEHIPARKPALEDIFHTL